MKKKQPAKKGFSQSRDNKFGKSDKPAGTRNRSSADGERPGRASAKDNRSEEDSSSRKSRFGGESSGDDKPSFRKRTFDSTGRPARKKGPATDSLGNDKPQRGKRSSFGSSEDKPAFKRSFGEKSDDKRSFGKSEDKRSFGKSDDRRSFGKSDEKRSFGKSDDKRSFGKSDDKRSFGRDEKPGARKRFDSDEKPAHKRSFGNDFKDKKDKPDGERAFSAFRKDGERPERTRSFDKEESSERPPRKRTYGAGAGKKSDDSAFHFHGDTKKGGRETPSGFNRKKFFDKTNERFADKQDRKKGGKVRDTNDRESTKESRESKESIFGPGEMPLNKFVAHCGLCSRRKAVDLIKEGKVTVNGKVVTEPATKVTSSDVVTMQDKKITPTKNLVYILLNKPKGYITTTDDPEGRKTVMDLIQDAAENERVYPVGRLDRNTSGLLLLTNDGELAQRLAHPKHNIKKIYQVELDKPLTKTDFDQIIAGVTLEDGVALVDALGYVDPKDKKQVGIEIHSGKNRIVRRIFEHLEYTVEKLDRVMYAGLTKKTLNRGQWRFLNEKEVILLKHFKK
ncbi:pseudouridine synthase [Chitinophaga arvensicola]|uniref:Pseudouridine synthase n=1 Tax=Chitinophaga arvensicola TaxID=29529 RepID=A0A1I0NHH7_9BACT|nr:pseudouridine synthase [Chitinophaga arvensicola]SEW00570.1 23S rRNA pseudouridine2605 synthase [Chitinophaga arvensicola]